MKSAQVKWKEYASDQEVRWCPGCGDYAILKAVQQAFADLGLSKEKVVIVSGIGCSSRFPYYMATYGFHTIHGRAPAIATGVKLANPELSVWVITGDGDGLSIGGNHLLHACRRNVDLKVILFNNRIYGLTKGQYSPTSVVGTKSKSSPFGSIDSPINPILFALSAGASFVARSVDIFQKHLKSMLVEAGRHKGLAFIEVYQNCIIFNDGTFSDVTSKEGKRKRVLWLEDDYPLTFDEDDSKALTFDSDLMDLKVTDDKDKALVWNSDGRYDIFAYKLAQIDNPTAFGIFRKICRPTYEELVREQIFALQKRKGGKPTLSELFNSGERWRVLGDGVIKKLVR